MARELPDYIEPGVEVLLVGINPGLRSALLGHHFAGRNNRFWDLLYESGLTPRRLSYQEDARLPEFGLGLTNIAARPTRSSSDLGRRDFTRGRLRLADKISRFRPRCVAFVGVTACREFLRRDPQRAGRDAAGSRAKLRCGRQPERIEGAAVFVLPNPSGRNAHFPYREMLRHFRSLARWLGREGGESSRPLAVGGARLIGGGAPIAEGERA